MGDVLTTIGEGLEQSLLMAYEVWWALVLGFAISAIVQAWVPAERIQATLAGGGAEADRLATGLGAASSSCSYAAIAIAKSALPEGRLGAPRRSPSSSPRPTWSGSWGWCSGC